MQGWRGIQENDATTQSSKLMCNVSLKASGGPTITTDLVVDTGSSVSILPEHMYKSHFSPMTLSKPRVSLTTYTKKPIPVIGCLELMAKFKPNCASKYIHIVPPGTPILGVDLFSALQLEVIDGRVTTSTTPASPTTPVVPVKYTFADTGTAETGTVTSFAHKVAVRPEVQPQQQKLHRLPFALCDTKCYGDWRKMVSL